MNPLTAPLFPPFVPASNAPASAFGLPTNARAACRDYAWSQATRIASTTSAPILPTRLRGDPPRGTTYRATLTLVELGRLDLSVNHGPSHTTIRVHCGSDSSYAWLAAKRPLLECRLAHAFGRTSHIELVRAGKD